MKHLKYISPIPFLLFLIAASFPFVEHRGGFNPNAISIERGYDFGMIFLPIGIMLLILLIANIKRTRFTAIVAFVLCFGLIFSIFLMQFPMKPPSSYTILHFTKIGYLMAFLSALILMVILLVNLVKTFLNTRESNK